MPYPYIECPGPPLQDTHEDNVKKAGHGGFSSSLMHVVIPEPLHTSGRHAWSFGAGSLFLVNG